MTTALLVMDVQIGIVERYAQDSQSLVAAVSTATTAARTAGHQVIYVRVAFRPGAPEVSRHNRAFAALAGSATMGLDDPATQVHPAVAPHAGDLDVVLRSLGVDTLVLAGIATSGVVLSTLRQAADLDYQLIVLRDGCADADPEVHHVLLDKVFPRQATVIDSQEWATTA